MSKSQDELPPSVKIKLAAVEEVLVKGDEDVISILDRGRLDDLADAVHEALRQARSQGVQEGLGRAARWCLDSADAWRSGVPVTGVSEEAVKVFLANMDRFTMVHLLRFAAWKLPSLPPGT